MFISSLVRLLVAFFFEKICPDMAHAHAQLPDLEKCHLVSGEKDEMWHLVLER